MFEVVDLKVLPNYHILLKFKYGEEKAIDFRPNFLREHTPESNLAIGVS